RYNFTGIQIYTINKKRPFSYLMKTAKEMIKYGMPIKCLEACVLAMYLTCAMKNTVRFPLSFKTRVGNNTHIVLVIFSNGKYGAMGLSRKGDLMDKPLKYTSLTNLIKEFVRCYESST
ncbi:hypothetical protein ROZALSC1DRAFT_26518, partial [Rozella allomycis CSF55]